MPAYSYEGSYINGEKVNGVVEAPSRGEAVAMIRKNCDVIISLKEVRASVKEETYFNQKVDIKSLALVCRQFAIILKAGLPLVQAVDLTAGQAQDKTLAKILKQVSLDIAAGWSLSYSLQQRGKKLPPTFIETVRSGEESGNLTGAFERLSVYYDRMYKTKSKTVSAMMYPAFVLVVAVIVVIIVMVYAVPSFSSTFASLGTELPTVTKILIGVSNFFVKYIAFILLVPTVLLICLYAYWRTEAGRIRLSGLKLKIPIFGKVSSMGGASQFSHTMVTMLRAGMPILQAIEVSGKSVANYCMSKAILATLPGVEAGKGLGECMAHFPVLPEMLVRMVAVGETTGAMEDILEVMAEYYDNEVDTATARALSMLEPVIILFLAGIVMVILFAVYLPMFSMYSTIG